MQDVPVWNQSNLQCPATAAHKTTAQHESIMHTFLKDFSTKPLKLKDLMLLMTSEVVLLTQFLYKLRAVFAHDKSYKILKHIHKMVIKLSETNIVSDLTSFQEQHVAGLNAANVIYVAPKPKYEYILVRLQGIVRLLAQILSVGQHYGTIMIQKLHLGHFMNVAVISMSFISRIWALALHTMYFLMQLFDSISSIFWTKGLLPNSAVRFLPEDYIIPQSLEDWLKSDETLKEIHPLLEKRQKLKPSFHKSTIWQSIKIDDDERNYLLQLKELVNTSSFSEPKEDNTDLQESNVESLFLDKFKPTKADIGELLVREPNLPATKKRKRMKKKIKEIN